MPLKILFMGTPDFAVPALQALIDGPDEVIGVVCQPDRKKGRGKKLSPPPVKVLAEKNGIQVLQPTAIKTDAFYQSLAAMEPDLMVVAAYGRILPGRILELPRYGAFNVHGSLLPKYRGAAPIQWAVMEGETETGVTIMQMDVGMDTGDILLPASLPIEPDDTAGTLFDRLAALGGTTLMEAIGLLKEGKLKPIKQDDSQACPAPMLKKEDGHINWQRPATELQALIRGLDPWPSAYGFLGERRFRFFKPQVFARQTDLPPGTVIRADQEGLVITTGKDCLLLREIQPEGKKRMPVGDCLNGTPISTGDCFT